MPDLQAVEQLTTNFAYWLDSVWPLVYPGATIQGIDPALTMACIEYAWIALSRNLLENRTINVNPLANGAGIVNSVTTKVDVIETTVKYRELANGAGVYPSYPIADNYLTARGLITIYSGGRTTVR